ncbi:hypothetical protein CCP3SC5AM1_140024 [Gammaproteobacteria bacterium]
MNRLKQVVTIIVVLILGAIILIGPLVSGLVLERDFGSILGALSEPNRWSLVEAEFRRGWFNSESRSILTFEGELAKQIQEVRPSGDSEPFQVTLVHRIKHGPVLDMGRSSLLPAAALVETDIEFSPNTRQWFQALFGKESPLRLRTLVRLDGEMISRIESPEVQGEPKEGAKVNWQGMGGTLEIGSARNTLRGGLKIPLLELTNDAGQLRFEQFEIRLDYQRHQAGLWLGDIDLDLKKLNFIFPEKAERQGFSFSGLNAASTSREEKNTLNALIAIDLDELSLGGYLLGSSGFTVELRGVDFFSFSRLYDKLRYLERQPEINNSQIDDEVKKIITEQLPGLMRHSPEVGITRLNLKTPRGEIQGKFRMVISGEEHTWSITPLEILQRLGVEMELSAPSPIVTDFFQARAINEIIGQSEFNDKSIDREQLIQVARNTAEQSLAALVGERLLLLSNDRYSTQATLIKGKININGRSRDDLFGILKGRAN